MAATDIWTWPESATGARNADVDLTGYKVVANDGEIGSVDFASYEVGSSHIVVDTGSWIFGRKSMIPARAVRVVDHDARTVQIDLTKDQIKNAPEYDDSGYDDYRSSAD